MVHETFLQYSFHFGCSAITKNRSKLVFNECLNKNPTLSTSKEKLNDEKRLQKEIQCNNIIAGP